MTPNALISQRRRSMYQSNRSVRRQSMQKMDSFSSSLDEINFINKYFEALTRSSPSDIQFIKDSLLTDPRKMMRAHNDITRRSNINNFNGEFPLYVAAKTNNDILIDILKKGYQINFIRKSQSFTNF